MGNKQQMMGRQWQSYFYTTLSQTCVPIEGRPTVCVWVEPNTRRIRSNKSNLILADEYRHLHRKVHWGLNFEHRHHQMRRSRERQRQEGTRPLPRPCESDG
jgi:hypothetical protein